MDLTESIAPRSDQQNFDDYVTGPRTVTITEVKAGTTEQPVEVHLKEYPGRPFKPSKSMRRVLVAAWGADASVYAGRRMTLAGDPTVRFGGAVVGGVRISHLSDIDKTLNLSLTTTRGKRAPYVVKPLAADPVATVLPVNPPTSGGAGVLLNDVNTGLTNLGITDRDAKLATVCQAIGRDLGSAAELTRDEAVKVLDWISKQEAVEPTLPTGDDQ